jgi:hypothetical protein
MAEAKAGTRRISEETVRAKTGKGWNEWFALIDRSDVKEKGHTAIARYLRDELQVSPWWAQAVTVRYEYERGLRE